MVIVVKKFTINIKINPNIHSYTYPILKMVGCVVLYIIGLNRAKLFPLIYDGSHNTLAIITDFISVAVCVYLLFCFSISICEIIIVHDKRSDAKLAKDIANKNSKVRAKEYSVDDIVSMVMKNDIIEIVITHDKSVIKIGSSSIWDRGDKAPHDKAYFINKKYFDNIEDFRTMLSQHYSKENKVKVISIDGVRCVEPSSR